MRRDDVGKTLTKPVASKGVKLVQKTFWGVLANHTQLGAVSRCEIRHNFKERNMSKKDWPKGVPKTEPPRAKKVSGMDWIDRMSEEGAKNFLRIVTTKLDEYDCDDYFGTEGWRHSFGLED